MSFFPAIATDSDAEEARVDGGAESDERESDVFEGKRFLASLYATANENGETRNMLTHEEEVDDFEVVDAVEIMIDDDGERRTNPPPLPRKRITSGVYATRGTWGSASGSEPLTVEEIDALAGPQELDRKHEAAALAALSFLSVNALHRVVGELLGHLDDARATSIICSRLCSMDTEFVQTNGKQAVQLLGLRRAAEHRIETEARDGRLAAETALLSVIKDYAHLARGAG